jgi:hypothetical protein
MSSFDSTIRNEIDYSINLKNTISEFIEKNIKLQRYYNLKEKQLKTFINSLCYLNKYYFRYKGPERKEIWPSGVDNKAFPITCSNSIIVLFPFEQISIHFPLEFLKDFTYLNQFSNILFEETENSLQKNILRLKYYNEINKKIMEGCKIIIATVEIESILFIDDTETVDISGGNIQPRILSDFFNKYM